MTDEAMSAWLRGPKSSPNGGFAKRCVRRAHSILHDRLRLSARHSRRLVQQYLAQHPSAKLHIGCGDNILRGWLNTEYESRAPLSVMYLDATQPFPIADECFDLIFSEHMIEHIRPDEALNMLGECRRILKPGGRIRIGTPKLEFLIELMTAPTEQHRAYAEFHRREYSPDAPLRTTAAIVADYYRCWGHQFVFDEPSLRQMLKQAGFAEIQRVAVSESSDEQLRGLENESRMPPGLLALTTLTMEAVKRA